MQTIPDAQFRRNLEAIIAEGINGGVNTTITGTVTSSSSTITLVSAADAARVQVGDDLAGSGIAGGATVSSITFVGPTYDIVMSASATSSGSETITVTNASSNPKVHTYSAVPSPGPNPTPASFTESAYDTYAAKALGSGSGVYTNGDSVAEEDFGDLSWVLSATPVVGESVYGYWVDYRDASGTVVVYCWENLPAVQTMNAAGDAVVLSLPILEPGPGSVSVIG